MLINDSGLTLVYTTAVWEIAKELKDEVQRAEFVFHTETGQDYRGSLFHKPPVDTLLVAATDAKGRVLGFCCGFLGHSIVTLDKLFVYPNYRRQGIGSRLIETIRDVPHVEHVLACVNENESRYITRSGKILVKHGAMVYYEL